MALSEQEQRLLAELEASLAADDPNLASTLRGERPRTPVARRRVGLAGLGFVVGLLGLVGGMQVHPVVSALGFVVMLLSVLAGSGILNGRRSPPPEAQRTAPVDNRRGTRLDDRSWRPQNDGR
ncbi:DUF3040 domain-containing protein [Luteococcus peritonei]|uniref:DUF3040 domain-containing protein n=1 Tax=Luteococcus peritonei TaxID=88874 RepID=A0ABW4RR05_9ACTN